MKRILRYYVFYLAALWIVQIVLHPSFSISGELKTWFIAAGILAVLNLILKPIVTILFLPIHALTLGLFSIVVNTGVFYLFLRLVPQASITAWHFSGFSSEYFRLPETTIPYVGTLFIASFLISLITNFFSYLVE